MHPSGVAHAGPSFSPAEDVSESSVEKNAALKGGATPPSLVLPSVPVDQLLDDHAVEFEECKRWSNSEAGQSARMTNPAASPTVPPHSEPHPHALRHPAL